MREASYRREDFVDWLGKKFHADFSFLNEQLPCIIQRSRYKQLSEQFGLPLSRGSLANLDSQGLGPVRLT